LPSWEAMVCNDAMRFESAVLSTVMLYTQMKEPP
jgi:hypothetical protein